MSEKQQIKELARNLSTSLEWQGLYEDEVTIDAIAMAEKLYAKGYRRASDVIEEIFAEIERMCIDIFGNFNHRAFAELKKKHREDE